MSADVIAAAMSLFDKTVPFESDNLLPVCRDSVKNSRIRRYLLNNHSEELQRLERLLDDFRRESGL
jgi:hypothetical protein